MQNHGGIAAIVWAPSHRHTEDYARKLGASFYPIHYFLHQRPFLAPIKYIPQCIKTWWVLFRQRPSIVFVFISPVFAALSTFVYCRLARIPYIMDIGGQALISPKWKWSLPLVRFLAKRAKINIIDHEGFSPLLEEWKTNILLLERPPIPSPWSPTGTFSAQKRFTITLISSLAEDEPIDIVLMAARKLPEINFYLMGDTALLEKNALINAPKNVTFTGYLTGDEFWELLDHSNTVMGLTTAPDSLLSAAIEGMIAGKPLILSRQPILTSYFQKGAVFIDHSAESMVAGVNEIRSKETELSKQIKELALEKRESWEHKFQKLRLAAGSDN